MASRDLKVTILGDDQASKAFGSAGKGASGFGKAAVAAFAAVGAAAVGVGVGLFKLGAEFDDAYDTIRVGTGATGKALNALSDDFRDVVKSVPTDFASASTAIADLNTRTGQTGEPLRQLTKQMLEMTRLTGGDLAGNIASVTRVFGDWSISTKGQAGTMDYLFKVAQTTGIGIDSLSTKVVQFGAPLRQLGFDFETSAAMLGKWEKEGVNTEAVLAGMKIGLGKLSKAGLEPVAALKSVSEAIKGAGSAGEANRIAIETFGQRAGPDMAAAIREGRFDLDALMVTLKGSKETILGAAADTMGFTEKWQILKNRVLVGLEPMAKKVFDGVGKALDSFSAWWAKNGPAVIAMAERVKVVLATAFAAVSAAVQSAGKFLLEHQTVAKVVFTAIGGLMVVWATVATVNAAKAVAAWVTTQVAAVKSAVVHAAQVAKMVVGWALIATKAAFHAAKVVASWALTSAGAIKAGVVMAAQAAVVVAKWVFMGAQSLLQAARMAAAWLIAMGPIGWAIAAIGAAAVIIYKNWDAIKAKTVAVWNAITGALRSAWGAIKGAVSSGIGAVTGLVSSLPGRIKGALGNLGGLLVNAGRSIVDGLIRGITAKFGALARKAAELAQKVKDFLPFSPAKEGPFSGRGNPYYSGRSIAGMLADGLVDGKGAVSSAMGKLTDVGDVAGMRVGGAGYINSRLGSTAASAPVERIPGGGVVINVNGAQDPRATALAVRDELVKLGRRNGNIFGGLA